MSSNVTAQETLDLMQSKAATYLDVRWEGGGFPGQRGLASV